LAHFPTLTNLGYNRMMNNIIEWIPIDQVPDDWKNDETPLLLADEPGSLAYEGYFHKFYDFQLDEDFEYIVAGQDIATRKTTLGFWYTNYDRSYDAEYSSVGEGYRSPRFACLMPTAPSI